MSAGLCRADIFRAIALAAFTAVAWCVIHDRVSFRNWSIPLYASHDALTVFAFQKTAMEGFYWPLLPKFNPHLGAPYFANWNDFPVTDEFLVLIGGLLSIKLGLFAAANLLVLVGHVLAALSFYAVCRALHYRWEWAMVGGLAFGLSPYAFQRGLHHLTLTYYWHIPLALLVCWWCGSPRGLQFGTRRFWAAVGIALITGLHNPYYTNMFLQLLGVGAIAQAYRRNAWRTTAAPLVLALVCLCSFLAMNADTIYYRAVHGKNTEAVNRSYQELEFYALRPLDLFMPAPGHRLPAASALAIAYGSDDARKPHMQGEPFAQYLGLAGIASLLWLGFRSASWVLAPVRSAPPPEAVGVLWVVLYSVVGGGNAFLGQVGLTFFRATNRYSIYILALSLLFAVRSLSQLSSSWHAGLAGIAMLISAIVICWDQLPAVPTQASIAKIEARISSDRAFAAAMEKALPPSAMIFQLPVMSYPESQPIERMTDYEHLRPYLYTSTLRYSYGSVKGRPQDSWQLPLSRLPVPEMVAALEKLGFSAVYLNRDGYADRGAALLSALQAAGRPVAIHSPAGDLVCVFLHPAARRELPAATPIAPAASHRYPPLHPGIQTLHIAADERSARFAEIALEESPLHATNRPGSHAPLAR